MSNEPVAIISSITAVIVFVLSQLNVVVDATVLESLLLAGVTLVSGLIARSQVTPVAKVISRK